MFARMFRSGGVIAGLAFAAACKTTIPPEEPAFVVVSPAIIEMTVGTLPQQLTAIVTDAAGNPLTGRSVTWSSNLPTVASVSTTGLVTALTKGGPVTIRATSGGKSGEASVTVQLPVAAVAVAPATALIDVGSTMQLNATLRDATGATLSGRPITWTSGNSAVATVSASGLVTAVASGGPTSITAASGTASGSASVTVQKVVASMTISPTSSTLEVGTTVQLVAELRDAEGNLLTRPTTWVSSSPALATVTATGLVTGVGVGGPVPITASSGSRQAAATVLVESSVASAVLSPPSLSVEVGRSVQLAATLRDAAGNVLTGRAIAWTASNPAIATVSQTGLVSGVAVGGPTFITASGRNWQASASVLVEATVASVEIAPASTSLEVGRTAQLIATLRDAAGSVLTNRPITWTSSNPAVATVSQSGLVSGVAVGGPTTIRASSGLPSGAATVVVQPTVFSVTLSPSSVALAVGQVLQIAATARDAAGNVLPGRTTTWASSSPAVASVSPAGLVTGVSTGPATITASVAGVIGTASVQVAPVPPPVVVKPLTGTWAGSTVISGSSVPVEYTITESNASIAGTNKWTVGSTIFSGPVSGSRNSNNVSMTSSFPGFSPFTFTGTLDGAGNGITGVINGSGFVNQPLAVNRISSSSVMTSHRQVTVPNGQGHFLNALLGRLR